MKRAYLVSSLEEKRAAVVRMESVTHGILAAELGVERRVLYSWRTYLRRLDQKLKREGSRERALLHSLAAVPVASMSFPRHEGIYPPDGRREAGEQP